jgi:hypothetical protein
MNIKQFLKPDWRKIIVVVIFILTSFISAFYIHCYGLCFQITKFLDDALNIFPIFIDNTFPMINRSTNANGFLFFFAITFLWYYFVSCLIFWIYDKFRKKS